MQNEAGYFGQNEPKILDRMPALMAEAGHSAQDVRKRADVPARRAAIRGEPSGHVSAFTRV